MIFFFGTCIFTHFFVNFGVDTIEEEKPFGNHSQLKKKVKIGQILKLEIRPILVMRQKKEILKGQDFEKSIFSKYLY